jgi:hypothetical protein
MLVGIAPVARFSPIGRAPPLVLPRAATNDPIGFRHIAATCAGSRCVMTRRTILLAAASYCSRSSRPAAFAQTHSPPPDFATNGPLPR